MVFILEPKKLGDSAGDFRIFCLLSQRTLFSVAKQKIGNFHFLNARRLLNEKEKERFLLIGYRLSDKSAIRRMERFAVWPERYSTGCNRRQSLAELLNPLLAWTTNTFLSTQPRRLINCSLEPKSIKNKLRINENCCCCSKDWQFFPIIPKPLELINGTFLGAAHSTRSPICARSVRPVRGDVFAFHFFFYRIVIKTYETRRKITGKAARRLMLRFTSSSSTRHFLGAFRFQISRSGEPLRCWGAKDEQKHTAWIRAWNLVRSQILQRKKVAPQKKNFQLAKN